MEHIGSGFYLEKRVKQVLLILQVAYILYSYFLSCFKTAQCSLGFVLFISMYYAILCHHSFAIIKHSVHYLVWYCTLLHLKLNRSLPLYMHVLLVDMSVDTCFRNLCYHYKVSSLVTGIGELISCFIINWEFINNLGHLQDSDGDVVDWLTVSFFGSRWL